MAQASTIAERAGIPAAAVVDSGFEMLARQMAKSLGLPNLRLAVYSGSFSTDATETLQQGIERQLFADIVAALTKKVPAAPQTDVATRNADPREVVFRGDVEEVNQFFNKKMWSDGLPIVPPTVEKVEEFLKYTEHFSGDVIAALPPAMSQATTLSIAINGVMAGCRPEYMPILIATVEAIAEPQYGLQYSGSTTGWAPMLILNGPIVRELGFNVGAGALRPGNQANSSVGRFLSLFIRNVVGYLPGQTDMAAFGHNFYVVLAEDEDALTRIGWEPLSVMRGFRAGSNVITVNSVTSMSNQFPLETKSADGALEIIADRAAHAQTSGTGYIVFRRGGLVPGTRPIVLITTRGAEILAEAGYSRSGVQQYIYEHATIPAHEFDRFLTMKSQNPTTACSWVQKGKLPEQFCESTDPERRVRLFYSPEHILLVVTGGVKMFLAAITQQVGMQGLATSKEIKLPANWHKLPKG